MTSEIRANTLKNRVGLGTVSFTNTGPVVSGIVTIANSTAAGVTLEDNAGVGNSLKITTPTGYVSIGSGNSTFVHLNTDRGIFYFQKRITVDEGIISSYDEDLKLQSPVNTNRVTINKDTGLVSILNDLDVDGHTNLDNVSIAGVTTSAGIVQAIQFKLLDNAKAVYGNSGDMEIYHNATNSLIQNGTGTLQIVTSSDLYQQAASNISFNTGGSNERLRIKSDGDVLIGGHTQTANDPSKLSVYNSGSNIGIIQVHCGTEDVGDLAGITFGQGGSNTTARPKTAIAAVGSGSYGRSDLCFYVDGTADNNPVSTADEKLRITSTGKIGIGTDNPDESLHIFSASSHSKIVLESDNNSANNGLFWVDEGNNTQSEFYYDHGGNKQHLKVNGNGLEVYSKQTNSTIAKVGHGIGYNEVVIPNGDVGIGTDLSGANGKFQVFGTNTVLARFGNTIGATYEAISIKNTVAGYPAVCNDSSSDTLDLRSMGSVQVTLDSNNNSTGKYFRVTTNGEGGSGTEIFRVGDNGNIGINETNPQQLLHVHNDTNYQGILINGNVAPRIAFARSTTTTGEWSVGIDGTNGNNFAINNSNDNSNNKIVISSSQVSLYGNVSVPNGNIVMGNSRGIDFSATTDGGSGTPSELLDDYEEGSFSPEVTNLSSGYGSGTFYNRTARYTKVGNMVTCWVHLQWWGNAVTSGNDNLEFTITGFPFEVDGSGYSGCNGGGLQAQSWRFSGSGFNDYHVTSDNVQPRINSNEQIRFGVFAHNSITGQVTQKSINGYSPNIEFVFTVRVTGYK